MKSYTKSNRLLVIALGVFSPLFLDGCMQELAETKYTPTVLGYEDSVAKANQRAAQRIANNSGSGGDLAASGNVPVIITNPFATGAGLGASPTGAFNNPTFTNAPISGSSAYGSLGNGVIQPGVFMNNTAPAYQQPSTFGNNIYSPATRQ